MKRALILLLLAGLLVVSSCSPLDPIIGETYFERIDVSRLDFGETYAEGPIYLSDDGQVYRRYGLEPNYNKISLDGVPTLVSRGIYQGFSLPVGAGESLYYTFSVPSEWDGVSDIEVYVYVWLAAAQPLGSENFRLFCEYGHYNPGEGTAGDVVPAVSDIVEASQLVGGDAQYAAYRIWLTIPYNTDPANPIEANDIIALRLYRANHDAGTEASGEIVINYVELVLKWDNLGSNIHW